MPQVSFPWKCALFNYDAPGKRNPQNLVFSFFFFVARKLALSNYVVPKCEAKCSYLKSP